MAECFGGPPCDGRQDERKPDHLAEPYPMPLTKPNQELRRELIDLGLDLEQTASEVLSITKDCRDVDVAAVLKLIAKLYEDADRVAALADEVKAGVITRAKTE